MTKTSRRPRPGKSGGKRRAGTRAAAKKRARAKLRASRPKQKPKRTPKPRSRARRAAAIVETRAAKRGPARTGTAKLRPVRAGTKRKPKPAKPRAPRPAPPPAFPQATGASAKNQLLFRMVKARASVLAAVQGMSAAAAERPFAEGKWNTRETILHLVTRDRARLREMEAALRGTRASWDGTDAARQDRENEEDLRALRHLAWEDAVRLLLTTREQLMEAVESIPEEPAEVWDVSHPLGWMFQRLPPHDLHHADVIKHGRTAQGA
jgi:uncharacterized damage-inducible protein DinB